MVGKKRLNECNVSVSYRLSVFGGLVIGCEKLQQSCSSNLQSFFVSSVEESLKCFWETEEVPAIKPWIPGERGCEEHFNSTTRCSPEGRFIVKLPLKEEVGALGDS